jgi:hypothetical protein
MTNFERFAKTPKAWDVLARPQPMDRRARALLLMANGRRSERELSLLLGEDVGDLARRLQHQGYLASMPLPMFGDAEGSGLKF